MADFPPLTDTLTDSELQLAVVQLSPTVVHVAFFRYSIVKEEELDMPFKNLCVSKVCVSLNRDLQSRRGGFFVVAYRTTSRCGIRNRFVSTNSSVMHRNRTQRKWFAMKKVREREIKLKLATIPYDFLLRFLHLFTIECCSLRSTAVHS